MKGFLLCFFALLVTGMARAQDQKGPERWEITAAPAGKGVYQLNFHVRLTSGFLIWSQRPGSDKRLLPTSVTVDPATAVTTGGLSEQGIASDLKIPGISGYVNAYYNEALFILQVKASKGKTVKGSYAYQLCDNKGSLTSKTVPFSVTMP